ncbi:MAG: hypothetical protein ACAH95_16585 [Fimbriimonas sp.]
MNIALAAAALLTLAPRQEPSVFTEPFVGLQFTHPATWKVSKKAKDRTYISIPVQGSTEAAELQIIRTDYHADKEIFQAVQLRINEQLRRQVVKQWEQEILGVPMLYTRINFVDKGVATSVLTGLFNTQTSLKMLVRLTAREADYDAVSYEFHQAMETLRTTDGKLPKADDPGVKLDPAPKKPVAIPPPPKVLDGDKKPVEAVKPTQSTEATVSLRKVKLLYPEGWTVDEVQGNKLVMKHPEVRDPLVIELYSTLDSDPPQRALFKSSTTSLGLFTQVSAREDKAATANKAGAMITSVWRTGKTEKGDLASYEAAGASGEYYFLTSYKQTDLALYKTERKVIEAMIDLLTIEPMP